MKILEKELLCKSFFISVVRFSGSTSSFEIFMKFLTNS